MKTKLTKSKIQRHLSGLITKHNKQVKDYSELRQTTLFINFLAHLKTLVLFQYDICRY